MRKTIAAATLALAISGCAMPQYSGSAPRQAHGPLSAYIYASGGSAVQFHVSRPAYVALFEIVPDVGTRMLYPEPGVSRRDGYVFSGDRVFDQIGFTSRNRQLAGGFGGGQLTRPRFLYLIASERPLDLDRLGPRGYGLRNAMDLSFYGSSPYDAMERLAVLALPSTVNDGSWTTDFFVDWPEAIREYRGSQDVLLSCNGYTIIVSREYVNAVRQRLCSPESAHDRPGKPIRGDSAEVQQPGRRDPVPPEERVARERIASSRQLQNADRRGPEWRPVDEGRPAVEQADGADEESGRRGRSGNGGERGRARPSDPASPGHPAARGGPELRQPERGAPEDRGRRAAPQPQDEHPRPDPTRRPATPAAPEGPGRAGPASPPPSSPVPRRARTERSDPSPRSTGAPARAPASRPAPAPASQPASRPSTSPAPARPATSSGGESERKCNPCSQR
jgi:hypothetical protein